MALIERDVVLQGQDENGNETIDLPITRLGNIEDSAEIKETPGGKDYIALMDGDAKGQMKKAPVGALMGGGASQYSETAAYAIGDYCNHDGKLYRCIVAIPEGGEVWNAAHWEETSVTKELQSAQAAAKAAQDAAEEANQKLQEAEESGGIGGSGNTIKVTFEAAFAGAQYTVTDGDETKTGTVPEGLVASVKVSNCNSTYTIRATADNGVEYATSVTTGAYYGQYTASLAVFNATINVTAVSGAEVKATMGGSTFTATADSSGVAAVKVNQTGTYTITATKDGAASNSASVNVTAEGAYTATVKFIVLTVSSPSGSTLTLTKGDMTLTRTSAGTDVFYLPSTGTWTATITDGTETASKSINVTAYQNYSLKVMYISDVLAENDWEKIHEVSAAGEGPNYWAEGDVKPVTINGTIGTLKVTNLKMDAFIIGFDHNQSVESPGEHRIHWQFGKISGKMVGLCDSHYNNGDTSGAKWFNWNHWGNYNYGGWAACDLRYDILGGTNKAPTGYGSQKTTSSSGTDAPADTPLNPVANTWMAALPLELRQNMTWVYKYTDNKGGGSDTASQVTKTKEFFCLLAEFEVQGKRTYANSAEQNYQKQYNYYKAGNSKIAYNHASPSSAVWQSSRSPYYTNTSYFCYTDTGGSPGNNNANYAGALLPGFFT